MMVDPVKYGSRSMLQKCFTPGAVGIDQSRKMIFAWHRSCDRHTLFQNSCERVQWGSYKIYSANKGNYQNVLQYYDFTPKQITSREFKFHYTKCNKLGTLVIRCAV